MKRVTRLILGAACVCVLFAGISAGSASAAGYYFTATAKDEGGATYQYRPEFRFGLESSGYWTTHSSCEQMTWQGSIAQPNQTAGVVNAFKFTNCFFNPNYPPITITATPGWKITSGPNFENVRLHITYPFGCQWDVTGRIGALESFATTTSGIWSFPVGANANSLTISNVVGEGCVNTFHIHNGMKGEFFAPKGMKVVYRAS